MKPAVCRTPGARKDASRTHNTLNSVGIRSRYIHTRSKLMSEAHLARAEATAYCAAAFSGTGSWIGFSRMASMFGRSRNILRKAENSVAAPVPTAPQQTVRALLLDPARNRGCETQTPRIEAKGTHLHHDQMHSAIRSENEETRLPRVGFPTERPIPTTLGRLLRIQGARICCAGASAFCW